jgi:tetratricopeptide (TPR) repeat protein
MALKVANMPQGADLALAISGASLALSIIALILNYRQRSRQDKLSSRNALTDAIAAIANTNIEMAKLRGVAPEVVSARRNINSHRRYLANHAELLTLEIADLSTDIDHNLIAGAFDAAGDYDRARAHWVKCVEKSPAPSLRAWNLRQYARFMFNQGNPEEGRKLYEESLRVELPDTDSSRQTRADTFMFWALAERNFGFADEGKRRLQQAVAEARRIGTLSSREEILKWIDNVWKADPREVASVATPSAEPARLPKDD